MMTFTLVLAIWGLRSGRGRRCVRKKCNEMIALVVIELFSVKRVSIELRWKEHEVKRSYHQGCKNKWLGQQNETLPTLWHIENTECAAYSKEFRFA